MRFAYIILLSLIFQNGSFAQDFDWAKQLGSESWDEAIAIKTDNSGNVYSIGHFDDTLDMDPNAGSYQLIPKGRKAVYISKLDASGNFVWAKQFSGNASVKCNAFAIDQNGDIIITGSFSGTADFDPGPATFNMSSVHDIHVFVCKLNIAGDFIWANNFGGNLAVDAFAIATDNNRNIFIGGYFDGTTDFDPGPGTLFKTVVGYSDIFVSKLDASGNLVWAKQMGGQIGEVTYAIAVDNSGNVYTTGTFVGTVDFDTGPGTFTLSTPSFFDPDIFVCKLDATGSFVWAKQLGGVQAHTLAIDHSGNVIVGGAGYYGWNGITIHKLNSSGNMIWSKEIMASSCTSISIDKHNTVLSTGTFFGTKDFDPGPSIFNLIGGNSASYICKLDSTGSFVWAKKLDGTDQTWSQSMTIDKKENIYLTGYFSKTTDFDPDTNIYNLHSVGSYDVFVLKLKGDPPGPPDSTITDRFRIYPNPTSQRFTIEFKDEFQCSWVFVRNAIGQLMAKKFVNGNDRVVMEINGACGVYFIEAYNDNGQLIVGKVLKL